MSIKKYSARKSTYMIILGLIIYFAAFIYDYDVGNSELLADPEYLAGLIGVYLGGPIIVGFVSLVIAGLIYLFKEKNRSKFYHDFAMSFLGLTALAAIGLL